MLLSKTNSILSQLNFRRTVFSLTALLILFSILTTSCKKKVEAKKNSQDESPYGFVFWTVNFMFPQHKENEQLQCWYYYENNLTWFKDSAVPSMQALFRHVNTNYPDGIKPANKTPLSQGLIDDAIHRLGGLFAETIKRERTTKPAQWDESALISSNVIAQAVTIVDSSNPPNPGFECPNPRAVADGLKEAEATDPDNFKIRVIYDEGLYPDGSPVVDANQSFQLAEDDEQSFELVGGAAVNAAKVACKEFCDNVAAKFFDPLLKRFAKVGPKNQVAEAGNPNVLQKLWSKVWNKKPGAAAANPAKPAAAASTSQTYTPQKYTFNPQTNVLTDISEEATKAGTSTVLKSGAVTKNAGAVLETQIPANNPSIAAEMKALRGFDRSLTKNPEEMTNTINKIQKNMKGLDDTQRARLDGLKETISKINSGKLSNRDGKLQAAREEYAEVLKNLNSRQIRMPRKGSTGASAVAKSASTPSSPGTIPPVLDPPVVGSSTLVNNIAAAPEQAAASILSQPSGNIHNKTWTWIKETFPTFTAVGIAMANTGLVKGVGKVVFFPIHVLGKVGGAAVKTVGGAASAVGGAAGNVLNLGKSVRGHAIWGIGLGTAAFMIGPNLYKSITQNGETPIVTLNAEDVNPSQTAADAETTLNNPSTKPEVEAIKTAMQGVAQKLGITDLKQLLDSGLAPARAAFGAELGKALNICGEISSCIAYSTFNSSLEPCLVRLCNYQSN